MLAKLGVEKGSSDDDHTIFRDLDPGEIELAPFFKITELK